MNIRRLIIVLVTAWVGSLWTVCGLVAPTLFAVIDDRATAGRIAGVFFRREAWVGLALGVAVAALAWLSEGRRLMGRGLTVLAVTALLPAGSQLLLSPLMQSSREAGDMARFGMLHGIAGGCFILACLSGLGLVLEFSREERAAWSSAD
jgi:hypothetical protein